MKEIYPPDKKLLELLPPQELIAAGAYVPSQFVLPFSHHEHEYVFNTLTKQCVETSLPPVCHRGEGYDELIRNHFLVPQGKKDEYVLYEQIQAMIRAYRCPKENHAVTILPTLACNAHCVYCYEEGAAPVTMTPQTAEQTLRYILNNRKPDKPVRISWFGGEPLLGERTIDRISQGLMEAGVKFTSTMTSNGSLITPTIVEKMVGPWQLKRIQISMDGAEEDYKARKRYVTYRDEYHTVIEAISRMSEAGIQINVRCNVDEENYPRLAQYLQDMKQGVSHKENVSLGFALLFDVRQGDNDLVMSEKLLPWLEKIEASGFRALPIWPLITHFSPFHCMADRGSVVICSDGGLYPCEHCPPESRFGDIWHGVTNEAARKAFCRTDRTREKCRTCPFLPDCTSFATCPVVDRHCREVRTLYAEHFLRQLVDKKMAAEVVEVTSIC